MSFENGRGDETCTTTTATAVIRCCSKIQRMVLMSNTGLYSLSWKLVVKTSISGVVSLYRGAEGHRVQRGAETKADRDLSPSDFEYRPRCDSRITKVFDKPCTPVYSLDAPTQLPSVSTYRLQTTQTALVLPSLPAISRYDYCIHLLRRRRRQMTSLKSHSDIVRRTSVPPSAPCVAYSL